MYSTINCTARVVTVMGENLTLDNFIGTATYEPFPEKGFNTNTETTDELIRKANECLEDTSKVCEELFEAFNMKGKQQLDHTINCGLIETPTRSRSRWWCWWGKLCGGSD